MSDLFDFSPKSSHFAVMGNPVKHSKSPQIHNLFSQQCGISLQYDRIQVDLGGFDQAVSHFAAQGGAGLNITVPYKVEAWELCNNSQNSISDRAHLAEAVNTLVFEKDGSVFGDNTDGIGLVTDIQNNIGLNLADKNILIIGAGGAVRGVLGPILQCAPKLVSICNRTSARATALAQRFDGNIEGVGLDRPALQAADLIINGTSASLGGELPNIDPDYVSENTRVYDMMYSPQPTVFMQWALAQGAAAAHDGLGMLVEQAAESFTIWHQQKPDSKSVINALRKS